MKLNVVAEVWSLPNPRAKLTLEASLDSHDLK